MVSNMKEDKKEDITEWQWEFNLTLHQNAKKRETIYGDQMILSYSVIYVTRVICINVFMEDGRI